VLDPIDIGGQDFVRFVARCADLLAGLRREAERIGAGRITWLVLPANEAAKRLYRRFGGAPDADWEHWRLALPAPDGAN
jgi:RimJ/RimL family protein N-acetyltransferase